MERQRRDIEVYYSPIDGGRRQSLKFHALSDARSFAQSQVGKRPTILVGVYAVGDYDGRPMVTVRGASLRELFPEAVGTQALVLQCSYPIAVRTLI